MRPCIDRILDRIGETPDGCWIFTGALSAAGYGVVSRGGRGEGNVFTHRATYEHFIAEIPAGLDLDHLCRVRACCNPWHLEPVTRKENVLRGRHPWVLRDVGALEKALKSRWGKVA